MKRSATQFGITLLLAGLAAAQEPPPEPPASIFGETVEVRVVNLEVVVTDPDGLPVTGLGVGDFRLTVDGVETPIRYFTEVRSGTAVAPEALAPEAVQPEAVASVPDLVPGEPVGTSYLVFVDDFFSIARDRDKVLSALRDDLGRLKPEDRMAIVAFDGDQLAMLTTWTSSTKELERALRDAMARPAKGLQRAAERRQAAGPRIPSTRRNLRFGSGLEFEERFYADLLEGQVSNMVSAAAASLRAFANPPGRKVFMLLNGGWPYEIDDYVANEVGRFVIEPGIQDGRKLHAPLIDTANQVGYTIFTVDIAGMAQENQKGADYRSDDLYFNDSVRDDARFSDFIREHNVQYALTRVAAETGGRALLNAQRLDALELTEAATRTYYFLGFEPTWRGDDKRHDLRVAVNREGLRVASRDSYVDFSRRSEVSAAVESSLLVGSGPGVRALEVEVGSPERVSLNVMRVKVKVSLPAEEITLLPVGDARMAELELRVATIDENGGRSDVPVIPMRVSTPLEIQPGSRATYETTIELRRVKNRLTVAVYDPAAGTLWASTVEVEPKS